MSAMDDFARGKVAEIEAKLEKYGPMLEQAYAQWQRMTNPSPAATTESDLPGAPGEVHAVAAEAPAAAVEGGPDVGIDPGELVPNAGLTADVAPPPAAQPPLI